MIPKLSLTRSRQYNGLVSFCTACLTVDVTVNQVPNAADLQCDLQPNVLSTIMNTECSNYSEMQACPQLRFRHKPSVKQTQNVQNSENLPLVKRLVLNYLTQQRG